MTEPSERDREMAKAIFQSDKPYGFVWNARLCKAIADALTTAREEGRREAIEECARVAEAGKYRQTSVSDCARTIVEAIRELGKEPQ